MRNSRLFLMLSVLVAIASRASAVDMQYRLPVSSCAVESGCEVTGVSDTPAESADGFGLVTVTGNASDVIWPVPTGQPANTSCGTGRPEWTRFTNPDVVTMAGAGMAVRSGYVFFQTTSTLLVGCYQVSSWHQLRNLVRNALVTGVPDNDFMPGLNFHWNWYYARCDDAPTNQTCVHWKAQLALMLTMYPARPQGLAAATEGAKLVTDMNTFKNSQGW